MTATRSILLAGLVSGLAFAQTGPPHPQFEVASIRTSAPFNGYSVNLGLHIDGAQARFTFFSLKDYVRIAYRVKDYQVEAPEWMTSAHFDISAKLPQGMGREQVPEMLQTLLADRFGLKFHRDSKEFPVYALVIGKGELKLKESPDAATEGGDASQAPLSVAASGGPQGTNVSFGPGSYFTFGNDHFEAKKLTMVRFADMLSRFTDRPVVDMTNLKGSYDFNLDVTSEQYRTMLIRAGIAAGISLPPEAVRLVAGASDDSLGGAIQALGLKLEPRKAPLEVLVVDHAEKAPTEN